MKPEDQLKFHDGLFTDEFVALTGWRVKERDGQGLQIFYWYREVDAPRRRAAGHRATASRAQSEHTTFLPAENFGFLPFYVAQDAHIFEQQGLDVQKVILPAWGRPMA